MYQSEKWPNKITNMTQRKDINDINAIKRCRQNVYPEFLFKTGPPNS